MPGKERGSGKGGRDVIKKKKKRDSVIVEAQALRLKGGCPAVTSQKKEGLSKEQQEELFFVKGPIDGKGEDQRKGDLDPP